MNSEYLTESGFISKEGLSMLRDMVSKGKNIVISGTVGSGKTTLVKALIEQVEGKVQVYSKFDESYSNIGGNVETVEIEQDGNILMQREMEDADVIVMDDLGSIGNLKEAMHIMLNKNGCILTLLEKNLYSTHKLIEQLIGSEKKESDYIDAIVTLKNSMGNREVELIAFL